MGASNAPAERIHMQQGCQPACTAQLGPMLLQEFDVIFALVVHTILMVLSRVLIVL